MGLISRYWILFTVDGLSRCRNDVITSAQDFFNEQFPEVINQKEIPDRNIQRQLMQWYQSNDPRSEMAEKCLRCFISNVLKESCTTLERKFAEKHYLYSAEILPLVLDAHPKSFNTNNKSRNESLTTQILSTFNTQKSNLSTWVITIFKSYSAVKNILKEHGIVQLTDWTILRYTTHTRLKRALSNLQLTPTEITQAVKLLDSFHQVYCTQLTSHRKPKPDSKFTTAKYPQPTQEQLNQIAAIVYGNKIVTCEKVLEELQKLATQLRETWMQPKPKGNQNDENHNKVPKLPDYCIEPFDNCLHQSVQQVIQNHCNYIERKGTQKGRQQAEKYLEALRLFHCDGVALQKIASQLGFTDQPHLSRLLRLKILREDIRRNLLLNLKKYVTELSGYSQSPEKLLELDTRIQNIFGQEVDELIQEAEKEAKNRYRLMMKSKLAQSICKFVAEYLHNRH